MADWRATLNRWVAGRVWMLATAGGAVAVFLITFAIVSAMQSSDDSAPTFSDLSFDAASSEATGELTTDPIAETEAVVVGDAELSDGQTDTPTSEPGQQVAPGDPPHRNVALPEFDESLLILGNSGDHGSILGGPGIVESSSIDHKTDWVVLIPSARIKAAIVRIGLTANNAFGAPDNPYVIGWWEDGPAPGQTGNVLLDGHRDFTDQDDNQGAGVCWFIPDTQVADFVIIRDNARAVHHLYQVTEIVSLPWDSQDGVAYLAPSREPTLTLVTCEGSFDEGDHNYSNRRILVAELTDSVTFEESNFDGDDGIYPGAAGSPTVPRDDEEDNEEETGDEQSEEDDSEGGAGDAEGDLPAEDESGEPAPDDPIDDPDDATGAGGVE